MASLLAKVRKGSAASQTISLEMNARSFERLAASFGFFSDSFLKSIQRAERDIKAGRVRTITSLADLE